VSSLFLCLGLAPVGRAHALNEVEEPGHAPVEHGTFAPVPIPDPLDQRLGLPHAGCFLAVLLEGETPAGRLLRGACILIMLLHGQAPARRQRGAKLLSYELEL